MTYAEFKAALEEERRGRQRRSEIFWTIVSIAATLLVLLLAKYGGTR